MKVWIVVDKEKPQHSYVHKSKVKALEMMAKNYGVVTHNLYSFGFVKAVKQINIHPLVYKIIEEYQERL